LFSAPSLAYTMGVLVLLFSGLLGYLLLQKTPPSGTGEISQVSDKETAASANYAAPSISVTANSNAVPANPAVNATGTVANTTAQKPGLQPSPPAAGVAAGEAPSKSDNAAVGGNAGAPPPPPPDAAVTAADQPKPAIIDKTEEEKAKDRITAESQTLSEQAKKRSANNLMKEMPAAAPPAAAAPSREGDLTPKVDARRYDSSSVRRVSGRRFERKDGVWYDSAYRGQSTTGVRRGTEAYLRLDSGLRSIADALPGTVVAVWNGKAYRIQ
jgi:hypothetical protein